MKLKRMTPEPSLDMAVDVYADPDTKELFEVDVDSEPTPTGLILRNLGELTVETEETSPVKQWRPNVSGSYLKGFGHRRYTRFTPKDATAVCWGAEFVGCYDVVELSLGGAVLKGGPLLDVGDLVGLDLATRIGVIRGKAWVARVLDEEMGTFVLAFHSMSRGGKNQIRRLFQKDALAYEQSKWTS